MILVKPKASIQGEPLNAMVDVVFLLLIFFLTTATYLATEKDLDSALPQGQLASNPAEEDIEPIRIYVMGEKQIRCNETLFTGVAELRPHLAQLGELNNQVGVIVDGEPDQTFGLMVETLNAVLAASFTNVSFAGRQNE